MSELRLNWTLIAKNLAAHLVAAGDVAAVEHVLDDADRDARRLAAPASFWPAVAAEYRARSGAAPHATRVNELIAVKQALSAKATP